jgi:shikimate kinase
VSGACRVLLVGMMGSGKSTIGRLLSAATGWPYVDNDELVRRGRGTTAREVLAAGGEEALRDAEADALALGLEMPAPVIVGVAAGTILDPSQRRALADGGVVVWLRAGAVVLAERAAGAEHRPWLDEDPAGWMAGALAEREPLYGEVADVVLQTDAEPPEIGVERLRAWLARNPACGNA